MRVVPQHDQFNKMHPDCICHVMLKGATKIVAWRAAGGGRRTVDLAFNGLDFETW